MTLLERRKMCQMTQENLAKLLGVDRSIISKWESSQILPSTANLIKLSKVYDCPLDDLIGTIQKDK